MTAAQKSALEWLRQRGGDGYFDSNGVACAQGERCSFERRTWNTLSALRRIEFYNTHGHGYGRLRIIDG